MRPTPPEPPCTSTTSPSWVPVALRVCTAVAPVSSSPDAAAQSRFGGRRTVTCSEATIRSAYPPATRHAMTSSPGVSHRTDGPTALTTPDTS